MRARGWTTVCALALACGMLFPLAQPALAAEGETHEIPLLMVVVGFDGGDDPETAVPYDDGYDWHGALFGATESPAAFYRDMSEGAFTFTPAKETSETDAAGNTNAADRANDGIVHVTLHRGHGAWGAVNVDSAVTRDFGFFVMEALGAAGGFVDFASYDANGNGELESNELAICLCVAGFEGASVEDFRRDDVPLVWSHAGYLNVIGTGRGIDNLQFNTYIAIAEHDWDGSGDLGNAEQEPLGTVYHELGHILGLPDLYAVNTAEGPWEDFTVGALSLMDDGGWQYADGGEGYRNIPTALDAWSRYVLGWERPGLIVKSGDYTVSSQLSENGYTQLVIPTSNPDEYFLIENRQPEGHDISLEENYDGTNGLVIWHIDNKEYELHYDANTMNDAEHHPGVTVENRTGEDELELLLYSQENDVPDARAGSGITVSVASEPSRDMRVHVEFADEAAAAGNAIHLYHDRARDELSMSKETLLEKVANLVASIV